MLMSRPDQSLLQKSDFTSLLSAIGFDMETDVQKAMRKKQIIEKLRPLIDDVDSEINQLYQERPSLYQTELSNWQRIKKMYVDYDTKITGKLSGQQQRTETPDASGAGEFYNNVPDVEQTIKPAPEVPDTSTWDVPAGLSQVQMMNAFQPQQQPQDFTLDAMLNQQQAQPEVSPGLLLPESEMKGAPPTIGTTEQGKPLDFMDKLKEIIADPIKLVPFLGSAKEAIDLAIVLKEIINIEEGKPLTESQRRLIDQYLEKERPKETTLGYDILNILGQLPAFAGELALTGGIYSLGKNTSEKAVRKFLKSIIKRKADELAVKAISYGAGATLQTIPAGATRIAAGTVKNLVPEFADKENESGVYERIVKDQKDISSSLTAALGEQWIEILSERSGGMFKVAGQGLAKLGIFKAFKKLNPGISTQKMADFFERVGYHGVLPEIGEERLADIGHALLGQELQVPTAKQILAEFAAFGVPGAVGAAADKYVESGEMKEAGKRGEALGDWLMQSQNKRLNMYDRPYRKAREAQEKSEKQRPSIIERTFGKPEDALKPLEREAVDLGIPIVKQDGSDISENTLRRQIKAERAKQKKAAGIKPVLKPISQETDPLYKPLHLLTPEDKSQIGKQVIDMVNQGYSLDKINALSMKDVQKLLRGELDEFEFREFVKPAESAKESATQQNIDTGEGINIPPAENIAPETKYESGQIKEFTAQNGTPDAIEYGLTGIADEDIPKIKNKIAILANKAQRERKRASNPESPYFKKYQETAHQKQLMLEALSVKMGKHLTFENGQVVENEMTQFFKDEIENTRKRLGLSIGEPNKALAEPETIESEPEVKPIAEPEIKAPEAEKQPWEMTRENFVGEGYTFSQTDRALNMELNKWQKIKNEADKESYNIDAVNQAIAKVQRKIERSKQHRESIQQSIAEGKPVPEKVLKDYPDLVKKAEPEGKRSREDVEARYPITGDKVDGRTVGDKTPNQSSIEASLTDFTELEGIREVSISLFEDNETPKFYSKAEEEKTKALAEEIKNSSYIDPLIVVDDGQNSPYILEGGHRFDALKLIGAKSFPALVVVDETGFDKIVEEKPVIKNPEKEPLDGWENTLIKARDYAIKLGLPESDPDINTFWFDKEQLVAYIKSYLREQDEKPASSKTKGVIDFTKEPAPNYDNFNESKYFSAQMAKIADYYIFKEPKQFAGIYNAVNSAEGPINENMVQELIEAVLITRAMGIIKDNKDDVGETFRWLMALYDQQPRLAKRTSTKVINQQYSTPIPLSWMMGLLAGQKPSDVIFDPTGGTGMLLIGNARHKLANEIDETRADILRVLFGDKSVTTEDAEAGLYSAVLKNVTPDLIVMNPPFNTMDEEKTLSGVETEPLVEGFKSYTGKIYRIKKLEHYIAGRTLEDAYRGAPKGQKIRAAILLGGNAFKSNIGRNTEELKEGEKFFFNWLYNNYNVTAHFNIDGELYKKMGTEFPVQLIIVDGKSENGTGRFAPMSADEIIDIKSYDELFNYAKKGLSDVLSTKRSDRTGSDTGIGGEGKEGQTSSGGIQSGLGVQTGGTAPEGDEATENIIPSTAGRSRRNLSGRTTGSGGRGNAGQGGNRPVSEPEPQTKQPPVTGGLGAGISSGNIRRPANNPVIDKNYGSNNTLVSRDRAEELAARLKEKLAGKGPQATSGKGAAFDPEIFAIGSELAAFHIEAGNKGFIDFSRMMIGQFGADIIPYLKSFYLGARNFPGMSQKGMNNESEIERMIELGEIDKLTEQPTEEETTPEPEPVEGGEPTEEDQTLKTGQESLEEAQVESYVESKNSGKLTTVMPRNIVEHIKSSLEAIREEHGDIDLYVGKELKMSQEQLKQSFGAEQIDDIALAINNMSKGQGFIIGDQAGIGKGRVAAALIHWGILQKRTPIFITHKADLFSDLYRDFVNIGLTNYKPFIFNANNANVRSDITDEDGNVVHKSFSGEKRKKIFDEIEESGISALSEFDFCMLTYSQVNKENNTQQKVLRQLISGNYVIMDECHNATGAESNTGEFFRDVVQRSKGVTFLSATYAKRPDNMALYNNTILGAYDPDELVRTMQNGGVPLQEIVSAALAKGGQYIRHERTYDGVVFKPKYLESNKNRYTEQSDAITDILREMVILDELLDNMIKQMDAEFKKQARRARSNSSIREHANFAPFASRVHVVIAQMFLALKVDEAVEEVLSELRAGEKVFLTLSNTMGSMLEHYVEDNGIHEGDPVNMNFADVIRRALERQLTYTYEDEGGIKQKRPIDWESSTLISGQVYRIQNKIDSFFHDLSASPIDLIISKIEKAGFRVGELTGRKIRIDFADELNPVLKVRADRNKKQIIREFNGQTDTGRRTGKGEIDCVIGNRSASTGISAHADKNFPDKRPRIMIMIQPELDINEVVQMFGRIFRTGQVHLPEYRLLFTSLPAETRPAAILTKKMKSLNANVSSSQKSATTLDVVDFMNAYGDKVVRELLSAMVPTEMVETIGHYIDPEQVDSITARQVTGWLAMAPVAVQEQFLRDIADTYTALINELNERNENKLIAQNFNYQAETVTKVLAFKGQDNSNPLLSDAYIETVEVNVLRKPLTAAQAKSRISKQDLNWAISSIEDDANSYYKGQIEGIGIHITSLRMDRSKANDNGEYDRVRKIDKSIEHLLERKENLETEYTSRLNFINYNLRELGQIGNAFVIYLNSGADGSSLVKEGFNAIFTEIKRGHTGSPIAYSNIVLRFVTNNRKRPTIDIPLSQLIPDQATGIVKFEISKFSHSETKGAQQYIDEKTGSPTEKYWTDVWEGKKIAGSSGDREIINIWTGNLFAAYMNDIAGQRDSIIRYTTKDGDIRMGIQLDAPATQQEMVDTNDIDSVLDFLKKQEGTGIRPTNDERVEIVYLNGEYLFRVPKEKQHGERYFANARVLRLIDNGEFVQKKYVYENRAKECFQATIPLSKSGHFADVLSEFNFNFKLPASFLAKDSERRYGGGGSAMADTGGYATQPFNMSSNTSGNMASAVELPEIVEFAKLVMNGKVPAVKKKLRLAKGQARGAFYPSKFQILLKADNFADPMTAALVLSHEIGHAISYLPDQINKRGNILGHLATLKKYMQPVYDQIYRNSEIRNELKRLSQLWKPFDPKRDKKYTAYRFSSDELYADAISVLFNNPALLEATAPQFYEAFFKYFDRKPEVKAAWDAIQDKIHRGWKDIQEDRFQTRRQAMGERSEQIAARNAEMRSLREPLREILYRKITAKQQKVIFKRNELRNKGIYIDPEDDPVYWIEELPYISSQLFQYYRDVDNDITKPMKAVGLTDLDLGDYLFLDRAKTERKKLANSWGYNEKAAEDGLKYLREKLGDVKFRDLEILISKFREIRKNKITQFMADSDMYSDQLMDYILNNEHYATFSVLKYLENKHGAPATGHIYKQYGTLEDIKNPFTATLLKDAAVIRAINRKLAAEKTILFLQTYFGNNEVKPAETRWVNDHREYLEPKDKDLGLIVFMQKGRMKGFYVNRYIAKVFENDFYEADLITDGYNALYGTLKEILVAKNPFWAFSNAPRDYFRTLMNLPNSNPLNIAKAYLKAIKPAYYDVVKGISLPVVRGMYENKKLIAGRYYRAHHTSSYTEYERIQESYLIHDIEYRNQMVKIWKKFTEAMGTPGAFTERLGKIATEIYLTEKGLAGKQEAHLVRSRGGSPDFYARAEWTRALGNMFMFSNAGVQGAMGTIEAAKENPAAFWFKMFSYSILPKLIQWSMGIGVFDVVMQGIFGGDDDKFKKMMDKISEHDKQNYRVFPVGLTVDEKVIYLVLPDDFAGQSVSGLVWNVLNAKKSHWTQELFNYVNGELPYSNLNPLIMFAFNAIQFLSAKNIYDRWRGETVFSEQQLKAGIRYTLPEFIKYQLGQLGLDNYYRFPYKTEGEAASGLESALRIPTLGGLLRRFVRISNRGEYEILAREAQNTASALAAQSIELKELLYEHMKDLRKAKTEPSRTDARQLYTELKAQGRDLGKFGQSFYPRYMLTALYGKDDPVIDAYLNAKTNKEKAVIIEKAAPPGTVVDRAYVNKFKRELKNMFRNEQE